MSSKLDQSLDEILADRPRGGRRGGRGGAPVGGVRKRSQRVAARGAAAAVAQTSSKPASNVPTGALGKVTATKIIVSNLPLDVSEAMIKEYFAKVVGPIKRCVITYGPNGQSRGIATVEFTRPTDAATAAQKYNGVEVDKKPMKVELVVDPNAPSSNFADRIGAPKPLPVAKTVNSNKPKPVTSTKAVRGSKSRRGRGGRSGSGSGREKRKTADELDAEMADYFDGGNTQTGAATTTGAPATNGGDIGMDDDVL